PARKGALADDRRHVTWCAPRNRIDRQFGLGAADVAGENELHDASRSPRTGRRPSPRGGGDTAASSSHETSAPSLASTLTSRPGSASGLACPRGGGSPRRARR